MKRKTLFLLTWSAILVMTVSWATPVLAFADSYQGGLERHSTFHYEFTRTLLRAAGFSPAQAEEIAVTCEAVDMGSFTGYLEQGSVRVRLTNTGRLGGYNLYWHLPRRGCTNSQGVSYPTPSSATTCNTCDYFTGTTDPCSNGVPELNSIDQWALYGNQNNLLVIPRYSLNRSSLTNVPAKSVIVLGIFLHSLADSYSHQYCMQTTQLRTHRLNPPECTFNTWHLDMEFGTENDDFGVPYTISAGQAVFQTALLYMSLHGGGNPALWTQQQANDFITGYATLENAEDRATYAIAAFNSL